MAEGGLAPMNFAQIYQGDCLEVLKTLESESVDCCVTSPPYWGLRDYGHAHQIGLEPSPFEYIEKLTAVFDEVRRALKPQGTCWIVIGDSYAGGGKGSGGHSEKQLSNGGSFHGGLVRGWKGANIKPKDLCGIPWRLAFALQDRGWYLRQDIIWAKPNPMPESVTDRCTRSHEYIFLLAKSSKYFYDAKAIADKATVGAFDTAFMPTSAKDESDVTVLKSAATGASMNGRNGTFIDMRNQRDVWTIQSEPYAKAHFATYPTKLVERCVLAGCPADGVVLDPFGGCGTTGEVAVKLGRRAVLIELNPDYVEMINHNLGLFRPQTVTA